MAIGQNTKYHRISLGDITPNNLGQLRKLNSVIFPIRYSDSFYKDVLQVGEYAKLAYFNDIPVGAICCCFDPQQSSTIYIQTIGVLAPYRKLGIASKLLQHILTLIENPQLAEPPTSSQKVNSIYAHVQIGNQEALNLYTKYGFNVRPDIIKDYYKDIQPKDAHFVEKIIEKER